jgi:hypothetical protein
MSDDHESTVAGAPTATTVAIRIVFGAILLLGAILRLALYGDPRLAIATADTQSYIDSSRAPLLSWESFSGRRLFTTNVAYKAISGNPKCGEIAVSMPAIGKESKREIQPCFEDIAVWQTFLSIASWLWLAFVVARHLKGTLAQLMAAGILVLFAFTPQIAEWDSILSSESLSVSLFILSFGFLVELAFATARENRKENASPVPLSVLWLASFALWLFTKDANLYVVPVTVMLLVPLCFSKGWSKKGLVLGCVAVLIGLFILGIVTSRPSPRWPPALQHSLETFIFPYPARMQFMRGPFGMPDLGSATYESWLVSKGPAAFTAFLLSHPGFVEANIFDNWTIFTFSYEQPYYQVSATPSRLPLLQIGEMLHPGSGAFYLVDTVVLISFWATALFRRSRAVITWTWVLTWLYLAAAITLFVSYFGDTDGIMRHVFPSLETFRLFMWLSLVVLIDGYLHGLGPVPVQLTEAVASDTATET